MIRNLYSIISPDQKSSIWLLAVLLIIGMLLETLSIGLVVPMISVIINPEIINNYPNIQYYFDKYNLFGIGNIIPFVILLLLVSFVIKNFFLIFLAWYKSNFSYIVHLFLSSKIFNLYINQSYTFFLNKNSAQLIRNINFEVGQIIGVINALLVIISETLVSFGIIVVIFYFQPITSGVALIFLILTGLAIYISSRKLIRDWGIRRIIHDGLRLKHLQQSFESIKDLKIFGKEKIFEKFYKTENEGSLRIAKYQLIIKSLPLYIVEMAGIIFLCSILSFVIFLDNLKPSEFIPILALYAAAAFRMMPSANRLIIAFQQIRFSMPAVDMIFKEFQSLPNSIDHKKKIDKFKILNQEIVFDKVSFKYPDSNSWIFKDLNFKISSGSFFGIVGKTGSGKSTLVDLIAGLLKPISGSVIADGQNINSILSNWQNNIGYVSQSVHLLDDSLEKNIAFGIPSNEVDKEQLNYAIRMSELNELVKNLPDGIKTNIGERGAKISGGERQRIAIARALYINPSLIIFDEATSSLDNNTEKEIIKSIENLKGTITIIMIAHRLSTLNNCDICFKVEEGSVTKVIL